MISDSHLTGIKKIKVSASHSLFSHNGNFYKICVPARDFCRYRFFFRIGCTEITGIMFFCTRGNSRFVSFGRLCTGEMFTEIGKTHHLRSSPALPLQAHKEMSIFLFDREIGVSVPTNKKLLMCRIYPLLIGQKKSVDDYFFTHFNVFSNYIIPMQDCQLSEVIYSGYRTTLYPAWVSVCSTCSSQHFSSVIKTPVISLFQSMRRSSSDVVNIRDASLTRPIRVSC